MSLAISIALGLAFAVVAGVFGLVQSASKGIRRMAEGIELTPIEGDALIALLNHCEGYVSWGEANGFSLAEAVRFDFPESNLVVEILMFHAESGCDHYVIYRMPVGVHCDFVSYRLHSANKFVDVSSGNGPIGVAQCKPPYVFLQVLKGVPLETLWARHLEAVTHVSSQLGAVPTPTGVTVVDAFRASTRQDAQFEMGRRLWPWVILYDITFGRGRSASPIIERYPAGHPRFAEARAARSALAEASLS